MAVDFQSNQDASVTTLVSGIIGDAQTLFKQQFELLKHEIRDDFRKAREASGKVTIGLALSLVGAIIFALMLAHLLAWSVPTLPLWACYGICGLPILAIGIGLFGAGLRQFDTVDPIPEKTVESLKENVQWLTHPK